MPSYCQEFSFFSRFKAELLENGIFESIEEADSKVFSYIEGCYNRIRLLSGSGCRSPLEFEGFFETKTNGNTFRVLKYLTISKTSIAGKLLINPI